MHPQSVLALFIGCVSALPGSAGIKDEVISRVFPKLCEASYSLCTGGNYSEENPNLAACAKNYESCIEKGIGHLIHLPTHKQSEACANNLYACRDKPDANEDRCVSEYNECWGLKPLPNHE